jgi:hypothetical protein
MLRLPVGGTLRGAGEKVWAFFEGVSLEGVGVVMVVTLATTEYCEYRCGDSGCLCGGQPLYTVIAVLDGRQRVMLLLHKREWCLISRGT